MKPSVLFESKGKQLLHYKYEECESTQDIAFKLASSLNSSKSWGVVTSDIMTKGQTVQPEGRWISPAGNLYSSFFFLLPKE